MIREVEDNVSLYFVNHFRETQTWEEEEVLAEVARNLDRADRDEKVASANRIFWAKEILEERL